MLAWLIENLSTIIICTALLAVVVFIIADMIKKRRSGEGSCGCGCKDCPMSRQCKKQ